MTAVAAATIQGSTVTRRVYGPRRHGGGQSSFGAMRVRRATRGDLLAIGRVADAAAWETYSGLLKPDTIGRLLTVEYSPASVRRRLLRGGIRVADAGRSGILGFVDAEIESGRIRLSAISTEPAYRGSGVAKALLASVRASHPGLPVCADVLLGNIDGERFYESQGFAPGEVIEGRLFDEEVVERRWWLAPPADDSSLDEYRPASSG